MSTQITGRRDSYGGMQRDRNKRSIRWLAVAGSQNFQGNVYAGAKKVKGVDYVTSAEQFGIEKGRQAKYSDIWQIATRRAKLEDAKEMLSENLDIELIKRITKLTENDLADLDISEK